MGKFNKPFTPIIPPLDCKKCGKRPGYVSNAPGVVMRICVKCNAFTQGKTLAEATAEWNKVNAK